MRIDVLPYEMEVAPKEAGTVLKACPYPLPTWDTKNDPERAYRSNPGGGGGA